MKIFILVSLLGTLLYANNACLKNASNHELASEVFTRLTSGGTGSSELAVVKVDYFCSGRYLYVTRTLVSSGLEKRDYLSADNETDCLNQNGYLNIHKSKIYNNTTLVVAICEGRYMYRVKLKTDLSFDKGSYQTAESSASCIQNAKAFNSGK